MSDFVPVDGSEILYQFRFCSFYHDFTQGFSTIHIKWWVCLGFLNHQQYQLHFSVESSFFSTQEERIPQVSPGWKLSGVDFGCFIGSMYNRSSSSRCHGMGREKCFVCLRWFTRWWFQICFMFNPKVGRISKLTNMFQVGWNHQLVYLRILFC